MQPPACEGPRVCLLCPAGWVASVVSSFVGWPVQLPASDCKPAGFWLLLRETSDVGESTLAEIGGAVAQAKAVLADAAAVAPKPSTIDRGALVEVVRRGGTLHGEKQAKPYAKSLENFKGADGPHFKGFFCVKLGRCQIPVAMTYNFHIGGDFFYCFPTCLPAPMLLPIPVVGCCALGEFTDNIYHLKGSKNNQGGRVRDEDLQEFGELMVVDEERGTLACYPHACCLCQPGCACGNLSQYPCVTCTRVNALKGAQRV